jgi:hypothetical protein
MAFKGNGTEQNGFSGVVGSECLVDVSTDTPYPCGPGSVPYCPAGATQYYGWKGSKLIIVQASMPHANSSAIDNSQHCSNDSGGGWWDAPWIGLSHGELVRSGKFGDCHCYAKDPAQWWLADGCGQFNAFEIVNDNNQYRNLEVFSTNLFAYHGYVGEGPPGAGCDISGIEPEADLVGRSTGAEALTGGIVTPERGSGTAFRRPLDSDRYFIMLLDVPTRTIQLALIHPQNVPSPVAALLPGLPPQVQQTTIDNLRALRLPSEASSSVRSQ